MFLLFSLLFNFINCFSMDMIETSARSSVDPFYAGSPRVSTGSSLTDQEESDVCSRAIDCLYRDNSFRVRDKILPHMQRVIRDDSVLKEKNESKDIVLRKLTSGDDLDEESHRYIHQLVALATVEAIEHSDKRAERRWNKKQVAILSSVTGVICTAITTLIAILVK